MTRETALTAAKRGLRRGLTAYGERGYRKLFLETVQQADRGCDFEFLTRPVTARVPRR